MRTSKAGRTSGIEQIGEWLSPAAAARRLGISSQRVRDLMAEGRLRYVSTALGRLIDPAGVEALIVERAKLGRPSGLTVIGGGRGKRDGTGR